MRYLITLAIVATIALPVGIIGTVTADNLAAGWPYAAAVLVGIMAAGTVGEAAFIAIRNNNDGEEDE